MTQVYNLLSPSMRMARILADTHQVGPKVKSLTSSQKNIARKLAHEGKSDGDILLALGVNMSIMTLRRRLRAINIHTHANSPSHAGKATSLPKTSRGGDDSKDFCPKVIGKEVF